MNVSIHQSRPGYGLGQAGGSIMSATGGTLMTVAPLTGPAAPFVALAGSITRLLGAIGIGAGCGQTCIVASQFADQAEALLKQNLSSYMSLATPRPQSAQQSALANFDKIWNGLVVACAGVSGAAGQNCVGDRQQGACHFQNNGNCWNWFIGYHDPIANDTNTYNDSAIPSPVAAVNAAQGSTASGAIAATTGGGTTLLLIGAGVLLMLFAVSKL